MILRGRRVTPGIAEGEALVTRQTISGWGGVNPAEGTVIERNHELTGKSFAGKVLVFAGAKGSSAWSHYFHIARLAGKGPVAMVIKKLDTRAALGAVVAHVPAVTGLDADPTAAIRTGDWVRVNGDEGTVEVLRRAAGA